MLRLLLPINFEFENGYVEPCKLDRSKFGNLTVMLVHLCSDMHEQLHLSQAPIREIFNLPSNDCEIY